MKEAIVKGRAEHFALNVEFLLPYNDNSSNAGRTVSYIVSFIMVQWLDYSSAVFYGSYEGGITTVFAEALKIPGFDRDQVVGKRSVVSRGNFRCGSFRSIPFCEHSGDFLYDITEKKAKL
ncbi:MAG: hypothetical protein LBG73_01015 [Spirochaetaceae bacterium]|nr:hypothetical protein [Spirochaetaceae bacterium]